ncbi:MAG: Kelch repeat-containing protein [Candidatus Micrarchaeia archaeon]
MGKADVFKAQSAIEFVVSYSWAILIIAVVVVFAYLFYSMPNSIAPSSCSFESGLFCNDVILATNSVTHVTKLIVLFTNTQPYAITNSSIYSSIDGKNTTSSVCSPSYAAPGAQVFCTVQLPLNASFNEFESGSIYINASYCGVEGGYSSIGKCSIVQPEVYSGTFAAHAQYFNFEKPLLNITLKVPPNATIESNVTAIAEMSFDGVPMRDAILDFSTNSSYSSVNPSLATTNQTGYAKVTLIGYAPVEQKVSVKFYNYTINSTINFTAKPSPPVLFCVAGNSDLLNTNASYYAPITSNGIGTWQQTTSYPSEAFTESCSSYNGYAYCADGLNDSGLSNSTFYAPITSNGIGTWHGSLPYPVKTYYQSCVVYNGRVYCIGGLTSTLSDTATNAAYQSILSDHGFGTWQQTTSYLISVYGQSCAGGAGNIYCVAGVFGGDNVYYAPITSTGIGTWQQTTSYPISTFQQSCVVNGNYIYCIGGSSSGNSVYYAPITSSGIGTWQQTTSYPIPIYGESCAVYKNAIYCVGGLTSSGFTNRTYYAPITSNGIGTWQQTTSYPIPVYGESCFT